MLEHLAENERDERCRGPGELDLLDIAEDDLGQPFARLRCSLWKQLDAAVAAALPLRQRERAGGAARAPDLENRRLAASGSALT